jgi:hypothetical protein
MTDLERYRHPEIMQEQWREAQAMAKDRTGLLPPAFRDNPGSILLAGAYGRALGIDPVTVLTNVYIVKGRPSMSAVLMHALIRQAGHKVRVWGDNKTGHCRITRNDDPEPFEETFTIQEAAVAGLLQIQPDGSVRARSDKGEVKPWEAYTKTMLRNRALSIAARAHCPEVILGLRYVPEDFDTTEVNGMVVDADPEPAAPAAEPVTDQAAAEQPAAFAAPKEPTEGEWRTAWFDQLADAVNRRNLADITRLGQDAATAGHSDLITAARAAWSRVQQAPIPDQSADEADQGDDDTGGADMDDPIVDAELVQDGDDPS